MQLLRVITLRLTLHLRLFGPRRWCVSTQQTHHVEALTAWGPFSSTGSASGKQWKRIERTPEFHEKGKHLFSAENEQLIVRRPEHSKLVATIDQTRKYKKIRFVMFVHFIHGNLLKSLTKFCHEAQAPVPLGFLLGLRFFTGVVLEGGNLRKTQKIRSSYS